MICAETLQTMVNVCMVTIANLNIYVRVQTVPHSTQLTQIQAYCLHHHHHLLNVLNIIAHIDMEQVRAIQYREV